MIVRMSPQQFKKLQKKKRLKKQQKVKEKELPNKYYSL